MSMLNRLMQRLPQDIDCGIINNNINRRYFTNFSSTAGTLIVTHEKAYLLVDFRYYEMAVLRVKNAEVILFNDLNKEIDNIIKKHNCKNVAIEAYKVTVKELQDYKNNFKNINFVTDYRFDKLIEELRIVKTNSEIYKILSAQEITELAFDHILKFISKGKTESEVARELNRFILDRADGLAFDTIVVSGVNSSLPHGVPSSKELKDGDFVTIDFGAMLDGYHSDMTRTVCIGTPSKEQTDLYKTVLWGQKLALDFIKSEKVCKDVDKVTRDYFESLGYVSEFGHGLGHGVGLEIHEAPRLAPKNDIVLKEGMVVTVEPGLYLQGKYGVRIEDMVVVTKDGCKNFTKCSKELIIL